MQSKTRKFFTPILTLCVGAAGGFVASTLDFPAPFLTGSALAVTIACSSGLKFQIPIVLRNLCFSVIGLSMGSGVTQDVIQSAKQWPVSLLVLSAGILITFLGAKLLLQNIWKFDVGTAILSASPGHLSFVLGLSSQSGGDLASISIIQSIRVLALVLVVPVLVASMDLSSVENIIPIETILPAALAASLMFGLVCGAILNRFNVPAAYLLGGMLFSSLSHISGQISGTMPGWIMIPAFITMGSMIGTRFSGITFAQLKRAVFAGISTTLFAAIIAVTASFVVSGFLEIPIYQVLIAFAPGGVEAMAAMAVTMNADVAFVAAHHVWRIFLLTFLAPMMMRKNPLRNGN